MTVRYRKTPRGHRRRTPRGHLRRWPRLILAQVARVFLRALRSRLVYLKGRL